MFDDIVGLNVRSMMMCTRHALAHMPAGSSIINLTSVAARNGGGPGASLYAGSKSFVSTATKGLAKELVGRIKYGLMRLPQASSARLFTTSFPLPSNSKPCA